MPQAVRATGVLLPVGAPDGNPPFPIRTPPDRLSGPLSGFRADFRLRLPTESFADAAWTRRRTTAPPRPPVAAVEAIRRFRYQSNRGLPAQFFRDRGSALTNGLRAICYAVVLGVLSACSPPRGTALQSDILKESQQEGAAFQVVHVTREALGPVSRWPATGPGLALSWPGKGQSQGSRALRQGDKVNLTIWDSQPNSLIATAEQRAVPVQGLTISPAGTIFVPYIDEVKVVGLTPEAARADIQSRMTAIVPAAQVQLEVEQGDRNTIELVSGVTRPGRYPVAANGVTILSVLAEAGGIPDALRNPVVRLQRGGTAHAALAGDLYRNPARDILMRGGDRIAVESDPRSFVVLGAAGAEKTVPFEKARHTLLEGLSLGSGVQETRANIKGVMVLRKYPAKALRADGSGPGQEDVIFTFDLGTGDGLFAARGFDLHPDDVILVTESPLPAQASVLSAVSSILGVTQRATNF